MTAAEVLQSLAALGVHVTLTPDGRPEADVPGFAPPVVEDLLAEARRNRQEIAEALRGRKAVGGAAHLGDDLRVLRCFACGGLDFWRGRGLKACRRCHPPAPGAETPE